MDNNHIDNKSGDTNTTAKLNKRTVFSLGLLIAFFLPWIDLILIRLSGFRIPIVIDRLSSLGSLFGNDMLYVRLSYLLFLIPICVIYNILIDLKLLGEKKKYFLNEFVVGLIFSGVVFILAVTSEFNLAIFGIGFWLTLLFSILGVTLDRHRLQKNWATVVNNFRKYSGNLQKHDNNSVKHNTPPPAQTNNFRIEAIRNLKATGKPFDEYDVELEIDKIRKECDEQIVRENVEQRKVEEIQIRRKRRIKVKYFVPLALMIAILLVLTVFRNECNFFSFSEGRPWQYNVVLIAPFDFPIYKSAEQLRAERDSILNYHLPYFTIDQSVQVRALAEFDTATETDGRLSNLLPEYIHYIRGKLIEIYTVGIMSLKERDRVMASTSQLLRIRTGNIARMERATRFFTIRSAYEAIINNSPVDFDMDVLRHAYVNEFIRENVFFDEAMTERARESLLAQISISSGIVQEGERIIGLGEIVTPHIFNILTSLKWITEEQNSERNNNRANRFNIRRSKR